MKTTQDTKRALEEDTDTKVKVNTDSLTQNISTDIEEAEVEALHHNFLDIPAIDEKHQLKLQIRQRHVYFLKRLNFECSCSLVR